MEDVLKHYIVYAEHGIVFETEAKSEWHAKGLFRNRYGYNYLKIMRVEVVK